MSLNEVDMMDSRHFIGEAQGIYVNWSRRFENLLKEFLEKKRNSFEQSRMYEDWIKNSEKKVTNLILEEIVL